MLFTSVVLIYKFTYSYHFYDESVFSLIRPSCRILGAIFVFVHPVSAEFITGQPRHAPNCEVMCVTHTLNLEIEPRTLVLAARTLYR